MSLASLGAVGDSASLAFLTQCCSCFCTLAPVYLWTLHPPFSHSLSQSRGSGLALETPLSSFQGADSNLCTSARKQITKRKMELPTSRENNSHEEPGAKRCREEQGKSVPAAALGTQGLGPPFPGYLLLFTGKSCCQ